MSLASLAAGAFPAFLDGAVARLQQRALRDDRAADGVVAGGGQAHDQDQQQGRHGGEDRQAIHNVFFLPSHLAECLAVSTTRDINMLLG